MEAQSSLDYGLGCDPKAPIDNSRQSTTPGDLKHGGQYLTLGTVLAHDSGSRKRLKEWLTGRRIDRVEYDHNNARLTLWCNRGLKVDIQVEQNWNGNLANLDVAAYQEMT